MSKPDHFIAKTPIRHNGVLYHVGEVIPASKLDKKTAEYHLNKKRIALPSGNTAPVESSDEDDTVLTKEALQAKNKTYTEDLCREAGYPEAEWGELNKEPLIEYYLAKQAKE